jgi:hypothetical protein
VLAALDIRRNSTALDRWQHQGAIAVKRTLLIDGASEASRSEYPGGGTGTGNWDKVPYQLLRLDLPSIRRPIEINPATVLAPDGSNLANLFRTLTRRQQTEFSQQLCRLVPLFSDVDVVPTGSGQHQLRYQDRWAATTWYTPDEVSDGTILMTAFLAVQYQSDPISLIAIEEPERGLHPYLLEQLVEMLRKLSIGELGGRAVQVVLATHSPDLLEYLRPEEVRFLDRHPEDGSVTVREPPVADPDWHRYFDEYRRSLRSAWLSGGLGGVPGI